MADPPSAAVILRIITRLQICKYLKAASMTILVYDYFLIFGDEVRLIWMSSWGIGKAIYFFARYSALIDTPWDLYLSLVEHVPAEKCLGLYVPAIWVAVFGIASAEAILFIRTSALYGNMRIVVIFIFSVWASVLISAIVITSLYLRTVTFGIPPLPGLTGCFQTGGSRIIYGDYVALLLQETIVVVLTIYRAVRTGVHTNDRLVQTLYRDGLFYYLYLLSISVVAIGNIVVLAVGPPELLELLPPIQRVLHSVLCTRVLLHARGATHQKEVTITDLRFAMTANTRGTLSVVPMGDCEQQGSDGTTATATQSSLAIRK